MSHLTTASLIKQLARIINDGQTAKIASTINTYGESIGLGVAKSCLSYVLGISDSPSSILGIKFRESQTRPGQVTLQNGRTVPVVETIRSVKVEDSPMAVIAHLSNEVLVSAKNGGDTDDSMAMLLVYLQLIFDESPHLTIQDVCRLATVKGQCVLNFSFRPYGLDVDELKKLVISNEETVKIASVTLAKAKKAVTGKAVSDDALTAYVDAKNAYDTAKADHEHAKQDFEKWENYTAAQWFEYKSVKTQVTQTGRIVV